MHPWTFAELQFDMDWNLTSLLRPDGPYKWKNTSHLSLGEFWEVEGEMRLLLGKHLLYLCFSQGNPACPSSMSGPPLEPFTWVLRPLPACVGAGETLAYLQCVTPNLTPQQFVPTHKTFLMPIPHVERNFMDSIAAELFSTWEVQNLPVKLLMKQKTDQKFRSCYFCFERKNSF